ESSAGPCWSTHLPDSESRRRRLEDVGRWRRRSAVHPGPGVLHGGEAELRRVCNQGDRSAGQFVMGEDAEHTRSGRLDARGRSLRQYRRVRVTRTCKVRAAAIQARKMKLSWPELQWRECHESHPFARRGESHRGAGRVAGIRAEKEAGAAEAADFSSDATEGGRAERECRRARAPGL